VISASGTRPVTRHHAFAFAFASTFTPTFAASAFATSDFAKTTESLANLATYLALLARRTTYSAISIVREAHDAALDAMNAACHGGLSICTLTTGIAYTGLHCPASIVCDATASTGVWCAALATLRVFCELMVSTTGASPVAWQHPFG